MAGAAGMSGAAVVIGVDGGGTKTDVVVADRGGTELALVTAGGSNHESIGTEKMAAVIERRRRRRAWPRPTVERADVVASAFGLAGVDWDSDVVLVGSALDVLALPGDRVIVNDSRIALRAGCTQTWGIVSNVGTGAVTAGVNRCGEWFRTMAVGWGEPSGSWTIVSDSLHSIAAHHHRTGPTTCADRAVPRGTRILDRHRDVRGDHPATIHRRWPSGAARRAGGRGWRRGCRRDPHPGGRPARRHGRRRRHAAGHARRRLRVGHFRRGPCIRAASSPTGSWSGSVTTVRGAVLVPLDVRPVTGAVLLALELVP